jgi:hypothetical protein
MRNKQCLCSFAQITYRAPVAQFTQKSAGFLAWTAYTGSQIVPSLCALAMCKEPARSTLKDPSCHHFGSDHQLTLASFQHANILTASLRTRKGGRWIVSAPR